MRAFLAPSKTAIDCLRRTQCERVPRNFFACIRPYRMYTACNLQHHPSAFISKLHVAENKSRGIHKSIDGLVRCQSSTSLPAQSSRMDSVERILENELTALRLIVPDLNSEKHKGQAGEGCFDFLVRGRCEETIFTISFICCPPNLQDIPVCTSATRQYGTTAKIMHAFMHSCIQYLRNFDACFSNPHLLPGANSLYLNLCTCCDSHGPCLLFPSSVGREESECSAGVPID